jgi:Cdc6-like AAA superfamily ATPase
MNHAGGDKGTMLAVANEESSPNRVCSDLVRDYSGHMADLWAARRASAARAVEPLAVRMRPRSLEELAGQSHVLGEGKLLRRMLEADAITSIILHGPPGTGKTTLAD